MTITLQNRDLDYLNGVFVDTGSLGRFIDWENTTELADELSELLMRYIASEYRFSPFLALVVGISKQIRHVRQHWMRGIEILGDGGEGMLLVQTKVKFEHLPNDDLKYGLRYGNEGVSVIITIDHPDISLYEVAYHNDVPYYALDLFQPLLEKGKKRTTIKLDIVRPERSYTFQTSERIIELQAVNLWCGGYHLREILTTDGRTFASGYMKGIDFSLRSMYPDRILSMSCVATCWEENKGIPLEKGEGFLLCMRKDHQGIYFPPVYLPWADKDIQEFRSGDAWTDNELNLYSMSLGKSYVPPCKEANPLLDACFIDYKHLSERDVTLTNPFFR